MYTMHSPSQGYSNSSADLYGGTRSYGSHLMTQNYSAYLGRDDPYGGGIVGSTGSHYGSGSNGSALQTGHYGTNSSMSQHTYPTLPPISHFPHQQDVYSSCVASSTRNHSYPTPPGPVSAVPRHGIASKPFWNCEPVQQSQQQQQQQQGAHCYPTNNAINTTHKSSPQAWSHSPNMMSSPSSTPSPISCPSTPSHHFASSPHHSQSHHNGIVNNSTLTNNGGGNSGSNAAGGTSTNLSCNNNPLQSLQKMVQIDTDNNDIRVQYETTGSSVALGATNTGPAIPGQHQPPPGTIGAIDSETGYPTYYNMDQNRMCATPQTAYPAIAAAAAQAPFNSGPFSPTMKPTQEMRAQPLQSNNCIKGENGTDNNGELNTNRSNSLQQQQQQQQQQRYASKLSKETNFLNRSCSTDTCSNGSPTAQTGKIATIGESVIQSEQTHDSVNSFRGSDVTGNSRDSAKSTDSDGMSSYAVSQCPTPSNTWKLNQTAVGQQPNEFRQSNFATSSQGTKSWWQDTAISPSANRPFTPHMSDCTQYNNSSVNNYSSSQVSHSMAPTNSNVSLPPNQSWSQPPSSTSPISGSGPQILTGAGGFSADGVVVVKKKRGRPFGSKNRRNLETTPTASNVASATETGKRKRKSVLVDIGVNTNLSFDVQASLNYDDSFAFAESTVKHTLPLVMRRKKVVGPVVRIDKTNVNQCTQAKYSIVNVAKPIDEDSKDSLKAKGTTKGGVESANGVRKNGLTKKNPASNSSNCVQSERGWICILCHKGPNYKGLGDLYGPYGVMLDKSKLLSLDLDNSVHETHEETETVTEQTSERRSLRRRADSNNDESKNKSATTNEETKETKLNVDVWIHEDCIVWSNNVYLDGAKIRNLEPAIVESFSNICTKCKLPGATLGCIYKNCNVSPLHYLCAKDKDCDLDEEKFILSCSKHKKRRIVPKEVDAIVEVSEATTTATNDT